MREIGTVLGGIGMLIFVFLVVNNASNATTVVTGIANSGSTLIKTLQGSSTI